mmetsp:Transcript_98807/g.264223  ORF Transcript_98807/g.264223 Transcript_98807/m.264223 type:complete len:257 (-) Transcript_98807:173-943(-)
MLDSRCPQQPGQHGQQPHRQILRRRRRVRAVLRRGVRRRRRRCQEGCGGGGGRGHRALQGGGGEEGGEGEQAGHELGGFQEEGLLAGVGLKHGEYVLKRSHHHSVLLHAALAHGLGLHLKQQIQPIVLDLRIRQLPLQKPEQGCHSTAVTHVQRGGQLRKCDLHRRARVRLRPRLRQPRTTNTLLLRLRRRLRRRRPVLRLLQLRRGLRRVLHPAVPRLRQRCLHLSQLRGQLRSQRCVCGLARGLCRLQARPGLV